MVIYFFPSPNLSPLKMIIKTFVIPTFFKIFNAFHNPKFVMNLGLFKDLQGPSEKI